MCCRLSADRRSGQPRAGGGLAGRPFATNVVRGPARAEDRLRAVMHLDPGDWDRPLIPTTAATYTPMTINQEQAVSQRVLGTIGDAVLARLARLSDEARLVARAGAVVGRCFSPDVIAGMVDRPLGDAGEMHARRIGYLRQVHRAEFSGADQRDGDRPDRQLPNSIEVDDVPHIKVRTRVVLVGEQGVNDKRGPVAIRAL